MLTLQSKFLSMGKVASGLPLSFRAKKQNPGLIFMPCVRREESVLWRDSLLDNE